MLGSRGAITPLRYHINFRHYLSVNSGKIHVKMTPWKSSKYLNPIMDYDNYEFRSDLNPFDSDETGKIKFLEFDVLANYVLYIPPYWWYSIQYDESNTLVLGAKYISMMNLIANSHHLFKYYIQQYSTKTKVVRTLISEKENLSTII
jgi:hypothetical protein